MSDFGARTFGKGKPPWVALMLRSFDGGEADPDTEDRSDWDDIPETLQHFALAFTGRKNGLAWALGYNDRFGSVPMQLLVFPSDNGLPNDSPYESYAADSDYNALRGAGSYLTEYDPTVYGQFNYEFSYTFAYLYSPSTDQINKSFQVFGYQQLFEHDPHIYLRNKPKQLGFWVEDFNITAHKIKR